MNLDWRNLSMSDYFEALEAHNASMGADNTSEPVDAERLRTIMKARENA